MTRSEIVFPGSIEFSLPEAAQKIAGAQHILVATHLRADGDATGSIAGFTAFLRACGKDVTAVMPEGMPQKYQLLPVETTGIATTYPADLLHSCDLAILLDCAVPERAGFQLEGGIPEALAGKLLVLDHHGDNPRFGTWNVIAPHAAATAELLWELCEQYAAPAETLSQATLEWFLLGILTDTGGLRFDNTDGECLRCVAQLLDRGARMNPVVNRIFFSKPLKQQQFESELIANAMRLACDGKFIYSCVSEELLAKYNFSMQNAEGIIDLLRAIDGTIVAALIYRRGDAFRVSLRSKAPDVPVVEIAHRYEGGGHPMAAGMTVHAENFAEVERILCKEITALLVQCGKITQS